MSVLKDKVTIITGGGRGIGFGIATAFAKEGSNLVLTGRNEKTLMTAKEKLENQHNISVLTVQADGADEKAVKNVIDKTIEKFNKIDILINNAQTSKSGVMLSDHTKEDFDLAVYSGLYATFFYMRECFKYMKNSGGRIINFASGAGISGRAGQSSYAASKEGIRGLSRVAATEWAEYGITVNVICPLAYTEGLDNWRKEYPDLFEKTIKNIPLGRYADAEKDIGRVCVFLASEDASFITGETISLQGGSGLRP